MSLFTDGTISAMEDLADHDSGILNVASTEGIDLSRKLSLAQDELAVELAPLLPAAESLERLVVTTPLRMWHSFRTLALVYRDAYYNQLNDRYSGKRDEYESLAKWAADKLIETGLYMVYHPIARADPAQLTFFPGNQAGATYYASVAWLNQQGQEGAAGDWRSITVPDGNVLSVRPANPPANAGGWNVYVGLSPDTLSLQNDVPLDLAQPWLQQSAVATGGRPPGTGQAGDYRRDLPQLLQRG